MIDRGAFDRLLAQEAARNGAECRYSETVLSVDADGTVTTSTGARLRPQVLIGADGPRSPVGAGDRADQPRARRYTASHGASDTCRTMRPTFFSAPTITAAMRGCFPRGRSPISVSASLIESRRLLKPLLAALCEKLAQRTPHWDEDACSDRRRHPGRRAFAIGRTPGAHRRVAGRRCCGSHQPGDRRRHRFGGAIRRARRARGRGFSRRLRRGDRGYEEELGDIFDAALNRALRRRRDVLACYAGGGRPDARALSDGWIASPHYWAA